MMASGRHGTIYIGVTGHFIHRIVEHRPPAGQIVFRRLNSIVLGIDPLVGDRRARRFIVVPNQASIVQILTRTRAADEHGAGREQHQR